MKKFADICYTLFSGKIQTISVNWASSIVVLAETHLKVAKRAQGR